MEEFYKFSKDMKYLALYWALGFQEKDEDIFVKRYSKDFHILIDAKNQIVEMKGISILNDKDFKLNTHKSFVVLECIDRLLIMGYKPFEIIVDFDNEYDIYVCNLMIRCFEWGHLDYENNIRLHSPNVYGIKYSSRLTSGAIERETKITRLGGQCDYGIFEGPRSDKYKLYNKTDVVCLNKDFIIEGDKLIKYCGKEKTVIVPEGIKELGSSCFWDNLAIEKVILPESLVNLGGDTFYNCANLKSVIIPRNVKAMGNNPFAGCPLLKLENKSPYFSLVKGTLYNKRKTRLIYRSISLKDKKFKIPNKTLIVGKHAFYLCNNLEEVTISKSVIKLENNPFSGCNKLSIINKSSNYHIENQVIYNKFKTSVIGCINSIKADKLELLPVKNICRNSFWNCKGIEEIVLPESLDQIGYNPFVSCSNIKFQSQSKNYEVVDDVLLTNNRTKLVCYPAWKAVGAIKVPDSVKILERGAFSGCNRMISIDLNNVEVISKTCFTNCDSLKEINLTERIKYVGEWAFAHCKNLLSFTAFKETEIDNNAFSNTPAEIKIIDRNS
ncbi:MAG: leucine-rich repeat domain-containing protein [Bacilli bacterium]|nr:leucine-rich repeat domain-containing protein [Bacilli bacterium]